MNDGAPDGQAASRAGAVREVFLAFLRLGLTSFGGPVAHLGYFRAEFVERRKWLTDGAYADLVALCQFLPGPASSQVGMAIGLQRAGVGGLVAAWTGFTLPSALLLVGFALGTAGLTDLAQAGWVLGLKAGSVAVVAHAVLGMARTLTPDARRAIIAAAAMILVLLVPSAWAQIGAIVVSGLVGLTWLRNIAAPASASSTFAPRLPRAAAVGCLVAFLVLLLGLPAVAAATGGGALGLFDTFYRAGALVFGGGHVVLPLLQAEVVQTGLVDPGVFLAGYGAAQAVPGPLFTFAAYLGAVTTSPPSGLLGAAIALGAMFLPSALLLMGVLPFWQRLREVPQAQALLMGVNAGVVGLLAAALYHPVFTEGIDGAASLAIAVAAFVAFAAWKAPAWAVVLAAALLGALTL
ncbi:chromate efflux transporter [Tessaracoccus caeni]|uniref:chromate efflux transporter n=1 Tax=Tessaracoccus caeni TaxID=3031239 RepID=UPI0023DBB105|nr:chromate efflux transporter [Tessaracoccus caeni]MDF1489897.1 chromate efflux transporter [Tessaracoccus caeni]